MGREMKDSGIEWIGEIPKDWEIKKMKMCANIIMGQSPDSNDILSNGKILFMQGNREFGTRYPHPSLYCDNCKKYSRVGDILLSVRAPIGAINESDKVYGIGRGLCAIKAETIEKGFFKYYLMKSIDDLKYYSNGSTFEAITIDVLQNFYITLPDDDEQQKIANFLDEKCTEFDNIFEKTRESIEEYKKLKQAVITQAVTKGIRGDRELKDSGIEWIGVIPKEWHLKKLRYLGRCQNGISKSSEYFGEGYPFVSYGDVYRNYQLPEIVKGSIMSTDDDRVNYSVIRGDVLFTRTSETIEEVGFSSVCLKTIEHATFAGFIIRFRPNNDELLPEYSKYYFRSDIHRRFFVKEMNLVTRASLGQELLKKLPVILPPLQEQQEIANYLEKQCGEIDGIIAKKNQYIAELESYKKSLIYEYVTGKKEVPQEYQT